MGQNLAYACWTFSLFQRNKEVCDRKRVPLAPTHEICSAGWRTPCIVWEDAGVPHVLCQFGASYIILQNNVWDVHVYVYRSTSISTYIYIYIYIYIYVYTEVDMLPLTNQQTDLHPHTNRHLRHGHIGRHVVSPPRAGLRGSCSSVLNQDGAMQTQLIIEYKYIHPEIGTSLLPENSCTDW